MTDTTVTTVQQNQLELLQTLNYDTAAVTEALAFTQNDIFKHKLFIQQYGRVYAESDVVARTIKAVQESKESLSALGVTTTSTTTASDSSQAS